MKSQNWNNEGCLQAFINMNKMAQVLNDVKDKYDYFIRIRTDIDILFPFPDKSLFNTVPKGIYNFDANYCRYWGGYAVGVFIHKDFIIDQLTCPFKILSNPLQCDKIKNLYTYNAEKFVKKCMEIMNLQFSYINCINILFVTDKIDSYTTWAKPQTYPGYDGFIKYPDQVKEALNNLNLWNQGQRWVFQNKRITLKKQEELT